jgi:hypothetical protein
MDKYGSQLIMSGGDYAVDDFSANQLYEVAHQINNIWYSHEKMNPCNITWDQHCGAMNEDLIKKELKEISPLYLSSVQNVDLVARVAGDFTWTFISQLKMKRLDMKHTIDTTIG